MLRDIRGLLLPLVLIGGLGCGHRLQAEGPVRDQTSIHAGLACEVFCSETMPRVAQARITWSGTKSATAPLTLDFTVYKRGFEQGLFGAFDSVEREQKGARKATYPMTVKEAGRQRDLTWMNLELIVEAVAKSEAGQMSVVASGLEPGLTYRFRLRDSSDTAGVKSETLLCQAAACVVDPVKGD